MTIDANQVGGSSGSLPDFPVLVNLTDNELKTTANGGKVTNSNGYDIIFRAYDSATCGGPSVCTLDHEIETYDGTAGTLVAWVRIPSLSKGNDTVFYMHFGDGSIVTPTENPTGVWDSNFKGVWHLKEDPANPAPQFLDSTLNPNDGTAVLLDSTNQVPGKIDGSLSFDATVDDHVNVPDHASLQLPNNMTVSGWASTTSTDTQARIIVAKWKFPPPPEQNYWLGKFNDTTLAFFVDGSQNVSAPLSLINIDGLWHHVVGVADGTLLRIYVDGIERNTAPYTGSSQTGASVLKIGLNPDSAFQNWDGGLDEIQVANTARSADWILTSYNNQNSPFPFYKPTPNFRSIGTNSANLADTGTASVTIGSTTVTFTNPLPAPSSVGAVGPGDKLVMGGETFYILTRDSDTQVTVQTAASATYSGVTYAITRAYNTLQAWETDRQGDLLLANRLDVGVAYKDGAFTAGLTIDGSTTDARHFMRLSVAEGQRHNGTAGTGAVLDGVDTDQGIRASDDYTVIEWFEFKRNRGSLNASSVVVQSATSVLLEKLLIHNFKDVAANFTTGIRAQSNSGYTVRNSIIYDGARAGIRSNSASATGTVQNCTVYGMDDVGVLRSTGGLTVTNTISMGNVTASFSGAMTQSYNLSSDASASCGTCLPSRTATDNASPGPGNWVVFVNLTPGLEDFHLKASAENDAINAGTDLSPSFWEDIDQQSRLGLTWDMGADELGAPTAVELASFSGRGLDGAVELLWETASELRNLGFHLYRATSPEGPYQRITAAAIPGLGSSPSGARYRYLDSGVVNGKTYFYRLEDIDTTGKTELHGPVSATPAAGDSGSSPAAGLTYGEPSATSLRIVERTARHVVLELTTGGLSAEPQADGSVRLSIPGFTEESEPGSPAIPVKRTWLEVEVGRGVRVASVRAEEVQAFSSLRPTAAEAPETVASRRGTVRAGRRQEREGAAFRARGLYPEEAARLLSVGYQGETKKALLELSPLRWDRSSGELVLARKLTVRLVFAGREEARHRERPSHTRRNVTQRLRVREKGLYGASFEQVVGARGRGVPASSLRVSRLGETVGFHLEPDSGVFSPGSRLYFVSEGESLNPYGHEAVYELELTGTGARMPIASSAPTGPVISFYWQRLEQEKNRYYQAGLLEAEDLWLWDLLFAPVTKSYPFMVSALALTSESSRLELWLQGVSDLPESPDHHLRVSVNGTRVAESTLEGKKPLKLTGEIPAGVLREGENQLEIENVGDTGASYSMVMLDRFALSYPRRLVAEGGRLEGSFSESGVAEVEGLGGGAFVLDVSEQPARWLGSGGPFRVEAGRRYLVVSQEAVLKPEVAKTPASRLKSSLNEADYLVIGSQALLAAAQPLVDLRRGEGLKTRAVSIEEVYSEFGFGESRPEALREFLTFAYHHWQKPAPRYVLLLGDASYDFKDYLQTGVKNQVPPLMVKTTYLRTASDPGYAAVNGEDLLPDVAIGRLPAATVEEARVMVEKILAYERAGASLSGPLVLVADNADEAGDFEADAEEIASSLLAGRNPRKIYLRQLGAEATRGAIVEALDQGASLLSYMGHGGIHLWAQENIFHTGQVAALGVQPRQPLVLTLNCLNGYFHFPYFNSLGEELVKAEGKGAIAAFSPSGLSLNDPAHLFHKALLTELLSGRHERLGDAVAAAQAAYAETGAFPELVRIYHLLGDPALKLRKVAVSK